MPRLVARRDIQVPRQDVAITCLKFDIRLAAVEAPTRLEGIVNEGTSADKGKALKSDGRSLRADFHYRLKAAVNHSDRTSRDTAARLLAVLEEQTLDIFHRVRSQRDKDIVWQ
jgi:hypothetical protein